MIMNSYGYKQIGINLGYKTFFNLNFILTYNMNMPVLSSLFYCVPCNRYGSKEFLLADAMNNKCDTIFTCGGVQQDSLAWMVICFLEALNRSATFLFSCNLENEHLFTSVTLT